MGTLHTARILCSWLLAGNPLVDPENCLCRREPCVSWNSRESYWNVGGCWWFSKGIPPKKAFRFRNDSNLPRPSCFRWFQNVCWGFQTLMFNCFRVKVRWFQNVCWCTSLWNLWKVSFFVELGRDINLPRQGRLNGVIFTSSNLILWVQSVGDAARVLSVIWSDKLIESLVGKLTYLKSKHV